MTEPFSQIQKAYETGRMSGSWVISGPKGVGKKDFATKVCSFLLKQNLNNINTFHPDIMWLECGLTEEAKKSIQKNILAGKAVNEPTDATARKREITIDDIRNGLRFLSLKGGSDKWRILIVNLADQMNENAQNALLKVLEEPAERCVILLLSQNLGKLLPTIKSRCRQIILKPLSDIQIKNALSEEFPEIENADTIIRLSNGSLGMMREICKNNGVALYQRMIALLKPTAELSPQAIFAFADEVSQKQALFDLTKSFLSDWLIYQIKQTASVQPFLAEDWLDLYQEISRLFSDTDRIYLAKKQVLITAFSKIAEVLR